MANNGPKRWNRDKKPPRAIYDPNHYYWDTKQFKQFREAVKKVIAENPLITIRDIKKVLPASVTDGHEKRTIELWTADSVEHLLGKEIEAVGVIWTRYQVMQAQPKRVMRIDGFKHNEYQRAKHKANKLFPTAAVGENYWV